jgi:hypothetical protein
MSLSASKNDEWYDGKRYWVSLTITASGSYSTGGDTLNIASLVKSAKVPIKGFAQVEGQAGYQYCFVPGSDNTTHKVKIFQSGTASASFNELAAGAYPAGITGDTIVGVFCFPLR